MIFILANCVASYLLGGGPWSTAFGVCVTLLVGVACGALNGLIVIFGRLQPIVATIATGAVFFGLALILRPFPGSDPNFNADFADALTGRLFGVFPTSIARLKS